MTIRFPVEVMQAIQQLAEHRSISRQELAVEAVFRLLEDHS